MSQLGEKQDRQDMCVNIEVPLNIMKEKIMYSLPDGSDIEDDAVIAINQALNLFLGDFTKHLKYDDKKIMIRNIKNCIDTEKRFLFLKKLTNK